VQRHINGGLFTTCHAREGGIQAFFLDSRQSLSPQVPGGEHAGNDVSGLWSLYSVELYLEVEPDCSLADR
jgi:hypothetical protein